MNIDHYSLERLAVSYLRDRDLDAVRIRRLSYLPKKRTGSVEPSPFLTLLALWVRFTALLIRYPANPARISAKLGTIGFPAAALSTPRSIGGAGHVGR